MIMEIKIEPILVILKILTKITNPGLIFLCFGKKDLDSITQDSDEPFKFCMPSRKEKGTIYVVNSLIGMCSCPADENA